MAKRYVYSLVIGGGNFPDSSPEAEADTWQEVIADAAQANVFYKRFQRRVIRIDYKEDGSEVKSMPFS